MSAVRRSYLIIALGLSVAAGGLSVASVTVAALEFYDSIAYSHNYDDGSVADGLVQFFECVTLVESSVAFLTMAVCFVLLTQRPSTVLTRKPRLRSFSYFWVGLGVLCVFAVFSVITQSLCAMWDSELTLFTILSILSSFRAAALGAFLAVCVSHARVQLCNPFASIII